MRIAAGILMFIGAFLGVTMLRGVYGFIPGLLGYLPWFWAAFVGGGGYYTLKRKNWKVCLTSSIFFLIPYSIVLPFLMWTSAPLSAEEITPFAVGITLFFFVIGILPLTFVYLRRREWDS